MEKRVRTTVLKLPLTYKDKVDTCIENEGFKGTDNEYLESILNKAIDGNFDSLANKKVDKISDYTYSVNQIINRRFIQRAKSLGYSNEKEFLRHIIDESYSNMLYKNTSSREEKTKNIYNNEDSNYTVIRNNSNKDTSANLDFNDKKSWIISGVSGSGKTILVHNFLQQLSEDTDLFLYDRLDNPKYKKLAEINNKISCSSKMEELTKELNKTSKELKERLKLLEKKEIGNKINFSNDIENETSNKFKPKLIIVESNGIYEDADEQFFENIKEIIKYGRLVNIKIVLVSSYLNLIQEKLNADIQKYVNSAIFKFATKGESKSWLGDSGAEPFKKGEYILKTREDM